MQIFLEALKSGWGALLEYLSAHVLTCLVPAFFIAGTVATENESKDKDDPEEQNSQDGSYQSSDTSENQDNSLKGIYERFIKFGKPSILIFSYDADKVPLELTNLVRVGAEGGAALSGTVQTENIGFEKIICNIVANPNIRYLILGGPESEGHLTSQALKALMQNGIDDKKRIIGSNSPHPFLYNIPTGFVERFRKQLTLIDLQFEGEPEVIRKAVWSCYQEEPVKFRDYTLFDIGAYPEEPLSGKITWRITMLWSVPGDKKEEESLEKAKELLEKLKERFNRS